MSITKHPAETRKDQNKTPATDSNRYGDAGTQKSVADIIGIFADEPLWDEVMAEVKAFRKQQDSATSPQTSAK